MWLFSSTALITCVYNTLQITQRATTRYLDARVIIRVVVIVAVVLWLLGAFFGFPAIGAYRYR